MVSNNYTKLNKMTLAGQVKKVLKQSFTKKNISLRFRIARIQPLHPKAIHEKLIPSSLYRRNNITQKEKNANSISNKKDEKEDNDIQWGKQYATKKKLNNIVVTTIPIHHESIVIGVSEINLKYYVDVPTNFTTINERITLDPSNLVVNIDEVLIKMEVGTKNFTVQLNKQYQMVICIVPFASFACKKHPRQNYSQNHVVTSKNNLNIM